MDRSRVAPAFQSPTMTVQSSSATSRAELATDFEEWFARKTNVLTLQQNATVNVPREWDNIVTQQMRATLDKSIPVIEFKLFSLLPTELRIKIWQFAILCPRIIHLSHNNEHNIVCKQPRIAVLDICRESRAETMGRFKTLFDPQSQTLGRRMPIIYVNPDVDTLYFRFMVFRPAPFPKIHYESDLDFLHSNSLHPVKRLAFCLELFTAFFLKNEVEGIKCLLKFRDLETLIIAIPLREVLGEIQSKEAYRKEPGYQLKFTNAIDSKIAAEDPSNPYRFQTNRSMDSQIEQRLGCACDSRPWRLQSLLDQAREVLREIWLSDKGWKIPQVEIHVLRRDRKE